MMTMCDDESKAPSAPTWASLKDTPNDYNDLYVYKTDTVFGVVYGGLDFAIIALKAGVNVECIFNKI